MSKLTFHEVPTLHKPLENFHFATSFNGIVNVSCIQGFIPGTLTLVSDDPRLQAQQVVANLKTVLEACGASLSTVLKFTLFLRDMSDFPAVNAVLNETWPCMPARSSVQAVIPRGCALAIEAVAAQLQLDARDGQ
jgi:2-iminobutanoate/2-iminopropanoate deaminase